MHNSIEWKNCTLTCWCQSFVDKRIIKIKDRLSMLRLEIVIKSIKSNFFSFDYPRISDSDFYNVALYSQTYRIIAYNIFFTLHSNEVTNPQAFYKMYVNNFTAGRIWNNFEEYKMYVIKCACYCCAVCCALALDARAWLTCCKKVKHKNQIRIFEKCSFFSLFNSFVRVNRL